MGHEISGYCIKIIKSERRLFRRIQMERNTPFAWQSQLISVNAACAAPLPDISFKESAAQTLERAIATKATVFTILRTTGRWVLTMSRTLDIGKVRCGQSHGARTVKTTPHQAVLIVCATGPEEAIRRFLPAGTAAKPELVCVPTKKFKTIHKNRSVPGNKGMRRSLEGLGRPSFFMY